MGLKQQSQDKALYYNSSTGEITYDNSGGTGGGSGIIQGSDVSFLNIDISGILKGKSSNNILSIGSHLIPTSNAAYDLGLSLIHI